MAGACFMLLVYRNDDTMRNVKSSTAADRVILVDGNDLETGTMDKIEAHRGDAKRHRATSVFLLNKKGEVLIQQRSVKKIVGALQWANTCCGNVRPGESYEQCAYRRLKEELGIVDVVIQPVHKFEYHVKCNEEFSEWEIDQVFVGIYDGKVKPNPDEVQTMTWKSFAEIQKEIDRKETQYAPWFLVMMREQNIQNYL